MPEPKRCRGPCGRLLPAGSFARVLVRGVRRPRSYCQDCERQYYQNRAALGRLARRRARLELLKRRHAALLAERRAARPRYTASEAGL